MAAPETWTTHRIAIAHGSATFTPQGAHDSRYPGQPLQLSCSRTARPRARWFYFVTLRMAKRFATPSHQADLESLPGDLPALHPWLAPVVSGPPSWTLTPIRSLVSASVVRVRGRHGGAPGRAAFP